MAGVNGLCDSCEHQKLVPNTRGSVFSLCLRSRTDPRYPRYPRVPVAGCPGYEPRPGQPPAGAADEGWKPRVIADWSTGVASTKVGRSRVQRREIHMAQVMTIRGSGNEVKIRSPWAAALLPFVTLGIYHLVWWYRINRELRDYGQAKGYDLGQSPTASLLALFPGAIIVVPALVTYWRGTRRVMGASRVAGRDPLNGWIAIVLYLVLAPALWAYIQISLNEVWRREADALPGEEAPTAPGDMPPPLSGEQPPPAP